MQKIAQFYKVSYEQFEASWKDTFGEADAQKIYEEIKLPVRATTGSAGYDFFAPCDIELAPGESVNVEIIFWAEYDEAMSAAGGEDIWQDATSVTSVPYKCSIEFIASQLSDGDEAVTEALAAEAPAWKETTTADNQ